jgi:hypothetical protein
MEPSTIAVASLLRLNVCKNGMEDGLPSTGGWQEGLLAVCWQQAPAPGFLSYYTAYLFSEVAAILRFSWSDGSSLSMSREGK